MRALSSNREAVLDFVEKRGLLKAMSPRMKIIEGGSSGVIKDVQEAYRRLFSGLPAPHEAVGHMLTFNSPALHGNFLMSMERTFENDNLEIYTDRAEMERRMNKMKNVTPFIFSQRGLESYHHIIAKSRGGSNNAENLIRTGTQSHGVIHRVFDTLNPPEQVLLILGMEADQLQTRFLETALNTLKPFLSPELSNSPDAFHWRALKNSVRPHDEPWHPLDQVAYSH